MIWIYRTNSLCMDDEIPLIQSQFQQTYWRVPLAYIEYKLNLQIRQLWVGRFKHLTMDG